MQVPEKDRVMISLLLICGLILSCTIAVSGLCILLANSADSAPNFHFFTGEPVQLRTLDGVFKSLMQGNSKALMQAGVILLISTPVCRVLLCIFSFAASKDTKYVLISSAVFCGLIWSLFFS